jgi:hypothetical protein
MTERIDLWTGGWWRFTKYEVHGEHVGPASDATLERYDPWEQYHRSQFDSGVAAPYQVFLKLGADIQDSSDEPDKAGRLILDWCSRFGLLGILPHTAIRIDLPVRYLAEVPSFIPVVRTHTRTGGRWISNTRTGMIPRAILQKRVRLRKAATNRADLQLGDFVPKSDPDDYREPTVVFDSQVGAPETTTEVFYPLSLTSIVGRYFPEFSGDGEEFECPLPLSPDFWRQYRERVRDLSMCARGFFHAAGGPNSKPSPRDLEVFITPAGLSLSRGSSDRIEQKWMCPSLLSVFGHMLIRDISAGKRILRCDCCGSPFVTDNYQARYCSRRCGFRLRQRRARAKATGAVSTEDQNGKEARK